MKEKQINTQEANQEKSCGNEDKIKRSVLGVTYEYSNGENDYLKKCDPAKPDKWKKLKKIGIITLIGMALIYGILVLYVVIVLGKMFVGYIPTKQEINEIKIEMTEYLEERYQMEFVVEKPSLAGNEGFGNAWYADAHPKDDQSLTFGVAQDGNSYGDDYLNELWTSQGKPEVEAFVKSIYGENINLDFYFSYYYDSSESNFDELKKLSYSDLINDHGTNLYCTIDCDIFLDENSVDKKLQAENTAKFCNEYFDRYNIGNRTIFVQYIDKRYKDEYLEWKRQEYKSSSDIRDLYDEKILINIVRMIGDELVNTKNEDVIKKFEY